MDEQVGIHSLLNGAKKNIPKMLKNFPEMPNLIHDVMQQMNSQQMKMQWESQQLIRLQQQIQRSNQRNRLAIIGGSLLISATISTVTPIGMGLITWLAASGGITLLGYSLLKS
jgi:dihydroxyacetone kinase-like predicted kinase